MILFLITVFLDEYFQQPSCDILYHIMEAKRRGSGMEGDREGRVRDRWSRTSEKRELSPSLMLIYDSENSLLIQQRKRT